MAKLHIIKPHRVTLNKVKLDTFEPDRFEPEKFDPSSDNEEWKKFKKEFDELNERNAKTLDKFRMTDGEMYRLTLDNMMMLTRLGIRALKH